ncbi:cytochrome c oxidase assembly protein [Leifsonia sp. NPDC014704]|uniref:cytochrome c oxidase assembly protein n=1 Tax=Leifsonia sp. NPDC014704 TaxID=3364123 RepID=UPI00160202A9
MKRLSYSRMFPALASLAVFAIGAALGFGLLAVGEDTTVFDPGPLVTYGLPVAKTVVNLTAAGAVGGLVLTLVALPVGSAAWERSLDVASWCAMGWTVASFGTATLASLTLTGPVPVHMLGPSLFQFFTEISNGQAWLATILGAGVLAVLCFATRSPGGVAAVAVIGFATLVPLALQGHAAGSGSHAAATSALWLHLSAASVWVGGLAVLVVVFCRADREDTLRALGRFSVIALIAFVVVGLSGVISAALRFERVDQVFSTMYGALVLVKLFAIVALGLAGFAQRRWILGRLPTANAGSWRALLLVLLVSEFALMGIAAGAGSVLARTPTPLPPAIADSAVQQLTGNVLPAVPAGSRLLDTWTLDPAAVVAACLGIAFYALGVVRARRELKWWPARRSVFWLAGWFGLVYVMCGAAGVYSTFSFTGFAIMQMTVTVLLPVLFVLGRPVRLVELTVEYRSDGSRGLREWLLAARGSRVAAWWRIPAISGGALLAALTLLYLTPWLAWAVEDPLGRGVTVAVFLVLGLGFSTSLRESVSRGGRNAAPGVIALILGFVLAAACVGVFVAFQPGGVLPGWYGVTVSAWGLDPIVDQLSGAVTIWVTAILAAIAQIALVSVELVRASKDVSIDSVPSSTTQR